MTTTTRFLVLLTAVLLVLAGCSSDPESPAEGPGEDQPGVSGELVSGSLADVPVPDAAVATSDLVEEQGRQTQSYEITASSPAEVQDFYDERLPDLGWELLEQDELPQAIRSTWTDGERELLIAAQDEGQTVALSLQVTDLGADAPGVEGS